MKGMDPSAKPKISFTHTATPTDPLPDAYDKPQDSSYDEEDEQSETCDLQESLGESQKEMDVDLQSDSDDAEI